MNGTLNDKLRAAWELLQTIVVTDGQDAGVVLKDHESPTVYDSEANVHVYKHEHFSQLGGALISLAGILRPTDEPDESQREKKASEILQRLYEQIVVSDSFGVPGSEFDRCELCRGGGSPYVALEHAEHCPIKEAEAFLFGTEDAPDKVVLTAEEAAKLPVLTQEISKCPTCGADAMDRSEFWEAAPPNGAELEARLSAVKKAIDLYYLALDMRKHGGLAQDRAFSMIELAVGKCWDQGQLKKFIEGPPAVEALLHRCHQGLAMMNVPDPIERMNSRIDSMAEEYFALQKGVPDGHERCPACKKIVDYELIAASPSPDAWGVCYECLPEKDKAVYDAFLERMRQDSIDQQSRRHGR